MTDREKTIVTAYTGVTMLQGEKLDLLYDYISKLIGRPIQTLDFVYLADKIQELSKPDFLKLCAEDTERHGEWIKHIRYNMNYFVSKYECSNCRDEVWQKTEWQFCPNCGADMRKMVLDQDIDGAGKDGNVKEGETDIQKAWRTGFEKR